MKTRSALLCVAALFGVSCREAPPAPVPPQAVAAAPASAGAAAAPVPVAAAAAGLPAAAPAAHLPPIDCPLRRAGVDPAALHPFEDTERYVAFLEREDRAAWQKPDAVVAALDLTGAEVVADLGAGSGYFTFRLARALPAGRVRAIDVQPELVRHVHHRALTEGVGNVEVVLATPDDPQLAGDEDLVFVCDVLHHVPDRASWLARVFAAMRPGARLALVEFREGDLPQGPPEAVKIPRATLVALVTGAGFERAGEPGDLLPYQHLLLFRKPPAPLTVR